MSQPASHAIIRALISVSDKSGLRELGRGLAEAQVQIYSTGGTRRFLEENGIPVHDVAEYTQFPEMLEGRLKTLHPKVFGGILARRDREDDLRSLQQHQIELFSLVIVNLYPFEETVVRGSVTDEEAVEQIDIGGPSLIRAAAKNHAFVTVVTNPRQYPELLTQLHQPEGIRPEFRRRQAMEAFAHTAAYDLAIAEYFRRDAHSEAPEILLARHQRVSQLRYGENPHQRASLYRCEPARTGSLVEARQLHGKELSYNNYLDLDAALRIVRGLQLPATAVIKHGNPCGAAVASSLEVATDRALAGDPVSAFGSILGCNRTVDSATAEVLARPNQFIEAILAPDFSTEAMEILTTKPKWKASVRLMKLGEIPQVSPRWVAREIDGGLLLQEDDNLPDDEGAWKIVTEARPSQDQWADLAFAWHVVRYLQSNAIAVARSGMLLGAGAGQMSRVDAVKLALAKAGERSQGAVIASDAFFPFPDSVELAADAGIAAIIQPGGSKNDPDVIRACNTRGLCMLFTGKRHFRH